MVTNHLVRPTAVAGTFYPAERRRLAGTVAALLGAQRGSGRAPRALLVPHAGYRFSGSMAARAYAELRDGGDHPRRVVLLGPPHRVPVDGLAAPRAWAFATPLGDVHLDREAIDALVASGAVSASDHAHAAEHSLEVQLPFLIEAIGDFEFVPLLVGASDPAGAARVLAELADEATLVVASSDLSHFHRDAEARAIDAATLARIERLEPTLAGHQACGCHAVNALLRLARERRWVPDVLGYGSSADAGGPTDRVVGYTAIAFHAAP